MVDLNIKWNAQADGPYVHIDNVIEYITAIQNEIDKDPNHKAVAMILGRMAAAWSDSRHDTVKARLDLIASRVDVDSLTDDLLALRDELAEEGG